MLLGRVMEHIPVGPAEAVHQKQQPQQEARLVHPVSPLAGLIHSLLTDLSIVETNNELQI